MMECKEIVTFLLMFKTVFAGQVYSTNANEAKCIMDTDGVSERKITLFGTAKETINA